MLLLGREVRLGEALLLQGGPEDSKNLGSGLPRRGLLRLGVGVSSINKNDQFWPFSSELFQQKHTISKQNHQTNLNKQKTHVLTS